ncbi:MAG: four helix bundle protein [Saprospiraceae bacterium]
MKKLNATPSPLREKTFNFAVRIYKLNQYLVNEKKEYIISKQIMKSGTNPGAMVRESNSAESGSDFIHKLSVAKKETGETQYWLELLRAVELISDKEFNSLYADTEEIFKMLTSSILTKKKNMSIKAILIFLTFGGLLKLVFI